MVQVKEKYFNNESPQEAGLLQSDVIIARGMEKIMIAKKLVSSRIILEEGARLTYVFVGSEGWAENAKVTFEFTGRESELFFFGFIIGKGDHKFPFETVSDHLVPGTKARFFVNACLRERSVVDYKGTIIIRKPAQFTDAYLTHHTLLLSDYARTRTIPSLEISANDVKAGHAASIGKFDEEMLFYLKSRGIDDKTAEGILTGAFFGNLIAMMQNENARKNVYDVLSRSIPNLFIS